MVIKKVIAGTAVLASIFATGVSPASSHCEDPVGSIWLLSGTGFVVYPGSLGCDTLGPDDPTTPIDESNTDFIIPGSNVLLVRWLLPYEPIPGARVAGEWTGSTLTFLGAAGGKVGLQFEPATSATGQPLEGYDSQAVSIGPRSSINGGLATVTLCFNEVEELGGDCFSRVYRTIVS